MPAVLAARDHRFDLVQIDCRTEPPTIVVVAVVVVVVIVIVMQYLVSDLPPTASRPFLWTSISFSPIDRSRRCFACSPLFLPVSTPGNDISSFSPK